MFALAGKINELMVKAKIDI